MQEEEEEVVLFVAIVSKAALEIALTESINILVSIDSHSTDDEMKHAQPLPLSFSLTVLPLVALHGDPFIWLVLY